MKIIQTSTVGSPMNEQKVREFLGSRVNLQIATIDKNGDPIIQPVWYYHDPDDDKIYVISGKSSQKVANIRRKNIVYFNLDEDAFPIDRKSTRLNSSHANISYAVFCLKKKKDN